MPDDSHAVSCRHASALTPSELGRLRKRLIVYATRRLRDAALAEDAVQESFIALLIAPLNGFRAQSQFETYAIGILRHKICDMVRERAREGSSEAATAGLLLSCLPAETGPHLNGEARSMFWQRLRVHLACLSTRERTAFWLREVADWEAAVVCDYLEVTPGHLHVLLFRARRHLRERLTAIPESVFERPWANADGRS